ncbi:MAG TPA: flagellar hook-length control protein FliK, partial [Phenylobacterium sp.]|nr:flagellar hook-length control protein FliK [Phenylobacterium sp.]
MAIQPIDSANRTLAVLAGHAAARIAGAGPTRLPGVYALVEVTPAAPAETGAAPAATPTPQLTKAQVVATAVQSAVVRQDGLAPLIADLAQALKTGALPPPAREAAARVLAQATPLDVQAGGRDIARALGGSGLLLEAELAANPAQSPVGVDLKAGLLLLRQALAGAQSDAPRRAARGPRPPPPYRGGPTAGQPPAEASLAEDTPPDVQRQRLAEETESALARLELLQIASLPQDEVDPIARWMFETPVMTPQGPAVAQFEISRDGRGRDAAGQEAPIWRARFGLDTEPLGPVSAHLSLSGGQIGVMFWAQRASAVELLRTQAPGLVRALTG